MVIQGVFFVFIWYGFKLLLGNFMIKVQGIAVREYHKWIVDEIQYIVDKFNWIVCRS